MGLRVLALWEILSGWVVITACCAPVGKNFGKNNFGKFRFLIVVGFWTNIFLPFVEYFSTGCGKCVLVVPRNTLGEKIFRRKYLFWTLSKVSSAFRQKLFIGLCLNCLPRVHKDIVRKLFLRKKHLFITLGCRAKLFCPKNSGGIEKSRFSVSIWKIWGKAWFLKKKFHQPLTCRGTLSAFCRNDYEFILHAKTAF